MIYLPQSRLTLSPPKLPRRTAGSFNGRTPRLGRGNLSSNLSPASISEPNKRKRISPVGKHWLTKPAVVIRGEREICNPATDEGRAEYKWRTILMWVRQGGWCCFREYEFCPGRLHLCDATFEHEDKRGAGKHDDRVALLDSEGRFIRHINGAAHGECNGIVGSRRLPIFHGGFSTIEVKPRSSPNV